MRFSLATLTLALFLLSSACDDPTSVGVELIDIRSGAPEVVEIAPTLIQDRSVFDVTGNARRAMLGDVNDPLIGGTQARAAVDFALPASVVPSAAFRQGTVTYAELQLRPDYLYGDTTATIDTTVSEIFDEWAASGNNSSDEIVPGPVLTTASFSPIDSVLTIPLPQSWISDRDADLRSQDFVTLFNGFLLEPANDGVLFGININDSRMMVVSGGDTVTAFRVSRNLSLLRKTTAASPPPGSVVLQDGQGSGLGIDFDIAGADLENVALSRIVVRVPYDSLAMNQALPANFVRPAMSRVDLVGITADSISVPLATSNVRDGVLVFDDPVLRSTFQNVLIDQSVFTSFALMGSLDVPPIDNTASALILRDGSLDPVDGPAAAMTVIRPTEL